MANVAAMSTEQRLAEALTRSKKYLSPDAGRFIDSFLSPLNLSILAGTLVVWAGSHFFGVGEIVDVLLLVVGAFTIGWSIGDIAEYLYTFADKIINARSDADLDAAAHAFSQAVILAGVTVIMALLMRKSVKEIQAARGTNVLDTMRPKNPGLPAVGTDPAAGKLWSKPGITSDPTLPPGEGSTSAFGEVRISPNGTPTQQALAAIHESVHQFLTPKFGYLRTFRVQLGMSAYLRSAFLQYLEEAIAETVAQIRVVGGFAAFLEGVKFPVANGYVSINSLVCEGVAIGSITAGTQVFSVQFLPKDTATNSSQASYPMATPAFQ